MNDGVSVLDFLPSLDNVFLSYAVLAITAAILIFTALADFRKRVIPNAAVILIGLLFFVHAAVAGHASSIAGNVAFATFIFIILLPFYRKQWMGGGDVKMLTVAFLWTGIELAFPFTMFLLLLTIVYIVGEAIGTVRVKPQRNKLATRIPFAPSIASALTATFLLSYVNQSPQGPPGKHIGQFGQGTAFELLIGRM
jgi:prepilin peptidase CpaA